jgi:hypothetical protein
VGLGNEVFGDKQLLLLQRHEACTCKPRPLSRFCILSEGRHRTCLPYCYWQWPLYTHHHLLASVPMPSPCAHSFTRTQQHRHNTLSPFACMHSSTITHLPDCFSLPLPLFPSFPPLPSPCIAIARITHTTHTHTHSLSLSLTYTHTNVCVCVCVCVNLYTHMYIRRAGADVLRRRIR